MYISNQDSGRDTIDAAEMADFSEKSLLCRTYQYPAVLPQLHPRCLLEDLGIAQPGHNSSKNSCGPQELQSNNA